MFRFVYRQAEPVGVHDVQRGLGMSSPSVAYYHLNKLMKVGLLREEGDGYTVDKVVFENMIRVRKTVLPLQTAYAIFFLSALTVLLTVMRPLQVTSTYVFAIAVVVVGFCIAAFEAFKVAKTPI